MVYIIDYLTDIWFFNEIAPFFISFVIISVASYKYMFKKLFDKTKIDKFWKGFISILISIICAFIISIFIVYYYNFNIITKYSFE